eukprot:scaffold32249_cov18-Tisochrysis_lutea.AAC.1
MDRVWRVKSKHNVCAISSYDLDGDGVPELICGWSNGRVSVHCWFGLGSDPEKLVPQFHPSLYDASKEGGHNEVEVRQRDTGALVHRDNLSCPVSSILTGDYRGDKKLELIVCGQQGEVLIVLKHSSHALCLEALMRQRCSLCFNPLLCNFFGSPQAAKMLTVLQQHDCHTAFLGCSGICPWFLERKPNVLPAPVQFFGSPHAAKMLMVLQHDSHTNWILPWSLEWKPSAHGR